MNTFKYIIVIFLLFLTYSFCSSTERGSWFLAASEFELIEVPKIYSSYSKIVPELFLYNLNSDARRIIPLSESKSRALFKLGKQKLKLIKELNALILEKDNLFLSIKLNKTKKKKLKSLHKQIEQKKESIFFAQSNMKIEELKYNNDNSTKNIVPWKNGNELFVVDKDKGVADSLSEKDVSAIITGRIKDISGYAYVSVRIETGLANFPTIEFSEAGRYEDIPDIVKSLSAQLYYKIQNVQEITIFFDIKPKTASLFVNEKLIKDFSKPITVPKGNIYIYAYADGYKSATKEVLLNDRETEYKLHVNLKENAFFNIDFSINGVDPNIYFRTKYYGLSPIKLKLPQLNSIMEFEQNDVKTFVVFNPSNFSVEDDMKYATAKLRNMSVKEKIEKRRKNMYWSLGALYFSLPVTLILTGMTNDRILAYNSGKLPNTSENLTKIKNMRIASDVMIGVSSALAINYIVHMILYLVAADETLPVELERVPVPMKKIKN